MSRLGTEVPAGPRARLLKVQVGAQHLTVPLIATASIAGPSLFWCLARL